MDHVESVRRSLSEADGPVTVRELETRMGSLSAKTIRVAVEHLRERGEVQRSDDPEPRYGMV